jgi:IS5 family transposase
VHSVHKPPVGFISKWKAHKRYEFGCKVSIAATSRGGWFAGALTFHGNPYDGHTLTATLHQVKRLSRSPEQVYVDQGCRGHGYDCDSLVHVDKRRRGRTARSIWRWMKRRAAIEPGIGHLKQEHRMDRYPSQGYSWRPVQCHIECSRRELQEADEVPGGLFVSFFLAGFSAAC